jgi:hypothetical protein
MWGTMLTDTYKSFALEHQITVQTIKKPRQTHDILQQQDLSEEYAKKPPVHCLDTYMEQAAGPQHHMISQKST